MHSHLRLRLHLHLRVHLLLRLHLDLHLSISTFDTKTDICVRAGTSSRRRWPRPGDGADGDGVEVPRDDASDAFNKPTSSSARSPPRITILLSKQC